MDTKELVYKRAHTELYEVIKKLSKQELEKIPQNFIENLKNNIDNKYVWKYDNTKKIEEQNFLVETKALIVEMYERYLCPDDKKEFWNNYNRICLNMIEDKKREEYDPNILFKNKQEINKTEKQEISLLSYNNKTWYKRFLKFMVDLINKIFKNK